MTREAPQLLSESSMITQWQQSLAIQLQRAGVFPKDVMGGHYPPSRLHPRNRTEVMQASLLAAQQSQENMPYAGIPTQTLNLIENLVRDEKINKVEADNLLQQLQPEYVMGLDVSHWQGELSQAWWNSRASEGYKFVFVKLLGGSVDPFFRDPNAIQNIERSLQAGIAVGGYIFVNPSHAITEQVDAAKLYADSLIPNMRLGMQFDLEIDNGVDGAVINGRMESAISYAHKDQDLYAVWVYSNAGFLNPHPQINLNNVNGFYHPWPASWTTAANPTLPHIWIDLGWDAWQFTKQLKLDGIATDGDRMKTPVYLNLTENNANGNGDSIVLTLPRADAQGFAEKISDLQTLGKKLQDALNKK